MKRLTPLLAPLLALLLCGNALAQSAPPKIAPPVNPTDAANKSYVDSAIAAALALLGVSSPSTPPATGSTTGGSSSQAATISTMPGLPTGAAFLLDPEIGVTTDSSGNVTNVASPVGGYTFAPSGPNEGHATISATGLNGHPAFANSTGYGSLSSTGTALMTRMFAAVNQPTTICMPFTIAGYELNGFGPLWNYNPGGNGRYAWARVGNTGSAPFLVYDAADPTFIDLRTGATTLNDPHIGCWFFDGTNLGIAIDGGAPVTTSAGGQQGNMPPATDGSASFQIARNYNGLIGATVGYDRMLTTSEYKALLAAYATRYGTANPTTATLPAADPTVADVLTTLNHQTAPLPVASGTALGDGLPTAGFTPIIGARFGTAAGQVDGAGLRTGFEMNYNGAVSAIGAPGDTGQSPGGSPFHAVARHYPLGSPNDLIPVAADGVHMRAVCSQAGNTDCSIGHVWGAFLRDPTADFRPGKTFKARYKSAKGDHSWNPLWMFQHDGGTGGKPIETDANDNFSRFGNSTPTGYQIDYGNPNIYGKRTDVTPYTAYAANGGGYSYVYSGPNYNTVPFDWSADFHDLVVSWDQVTEVQSVLVDGKLVAQAYQPFAIDCPKDSGGNCTGLDVLFGNQAIPNFSTGSDSAVNNDGITDGWTLVLQEYDMFSGALTPAQALAFAPAGATNALPIANVNGPTPPAGQHGLTMNDHGVAASVPTASPDITANTFAVTWTGSFTAGDISNGAMTLGHWGMYDDRLRARLAPSGKLEVCWYGVAVSGPALNFNDSHMCIQSTASFAPQANAVYDLEWDANPGAGTATFYAQPAGGAKTQLGAANVATSHNYYSNLDVPAVPTTAFFGTGQNWHVGQGNNDSPPNPAPDGRNAFSGTFTKASLSANGTMILSPVVGASSISDATGATWKAYTPALGGSAVFDSHLQAGGPAATPPPPPPVPAGTEAVTASLGAASFRNFGILSGTTVSQATSGSSPVVITAPSQPTDTFQGVMTPATAGPGTWTATLTAAGPGGAGSSGPLYSTGLLLGHAGAPLPSYAQSFAYSDHSYDALWTPTLGYGFGGNQPFNSLGQAYCIRAVRDASNWTFLGAGAPCAAGSFVQFAQTPLASLGTVDSIGVFANPNGNGVSNAAGGVTMSGWIYSAGANPQAAAQ